MNTEGLTGPINIGNPTEFTIKQLAELVVANGSISSIPFPSFLLFSSRLSLPVPFFSKRLNNILNNDTNQLHNSQTHKHNQISASPKG